MVGVLALIGGLAAACFVKTFGVAFWGGLAAREPNKLRRRPWLCASGWYCWPQAVFGSEFSRAFCCAHWSRWSKCLIPGAGVPEETLSIARIIPWVAAIVLGTGALVALFKRRERMARTWACGLARAFEPHAIHLHGFLETNPFCLRPSLQARSQSRDSSRLISHTFPFLSRTVSVRTTSYERALYRPFVELIVSLAHRLRRLQTGNIQVYLLYIFLALVSFLAFLRFQR